MEKYQKGLFPFAKAERIHAMHVRLKALEKSMREQTIPFEHRTDANKEIVELTEKVMRGQSAPSFDVKEFDKFKRWYRGKEEYRTMINEKIAGTWVEPEKTPKEK